MKKRNRSDADYVGYGVPPQHSKFKVGNREHLKRKKKTKKKATDLADEIRDFLTEVITYRDGHKTKRGRRIDVQLLKLRRSAENGNLVAAEELISMRENPTDFPNFERHILVFEEDWAFI